mmetsp:Transcript_115680/g.327847  ORF Transcript_115680/g.327847 Transcript_115680/m.327847 type:complete len:207 (+) Transcript_115680:411-1031(+)
MAPHNQVAPDECHQGDQLEDVRAELEVQQHAARRVHEGELAEGHGPRRMALGGEVRPLAREDIVAAHLVVSRGMEDHLADAEGREVDDDQLREPLALGGLLGAYVGRGRVGGSRRVGGATETVYPQALTFRDGVANECHERTCEVRHACDRVGGAQENRWRVHAEQQREPAARHELPKEGPVHCVAHSGVNLPLGEDVAQRVGVPG